MSKDLERLLQADGDASAELPDDLWAKIEEDLDQGGLRDALTSLSTPLRRFLAMCGLGVGGGLLMAVQNVRTDLDGQGWALFGACASVYGIGAVWAMSYALKSRGEATGPPGAAVAAGALGLVLWSAVAPWPGMANVPASAHLHCFAMTSIAVAVATTWFALLDRARTPTPWRIGLGALGTGMAAFVFQGAFCPGVDVVHLIVGHAGAGLIGAGVAMALASGVRRVT